MDYTELNSAFRELGIFSNTAENHGVLCGLICAKGQIHFISWLDVISAVNPELNQEMETAGSLYGMNQNPVDFEDKMQYRSIVRHIYDDTVSRLLSDDFSFQLILPDDEYHLGQRTEALTDWVKGFLYGLGIGDNENISLLPDEISEVLEDFVEITRAYHEDNESEPDEAAFLELEEYVRAGVILIYEELESERTSNLGSEVIH